MITKYKSRIWHKIPHYQKKNPNVLKFMNVMRKIEKVVARSFLCSAHKEHITTQRDNSATRAGHRTSASENFVCQEWNLQRCKLGRLAGLGRFLQTSGVNIFLILKHWAFFSLVETVKGNNTHCDVTFHCKDTIVSIKDIVCDSKQECLNWIM